MVVNINAQEVGTDRSTYIVAEAGINHNGDLSLAKELVTAAKDAGADAVKFQTYETEKRVDKDSDLFDILDQCELSRAEQEELFEFADEEGMTAFSTPFNLGSVEFLDEIDVPAFKIASFHITHKKLLRKIAETGKPVIFSRGMATSEEIHEAVEIFEKHDTSHVLLHCVSSYPTEPEDANLEIIRTLDDEFSCPVGFSDHTLGASVPSLSVAVGADMIEKHFTLDSSMDGPDHELSADPEEMQTLVDEVDHVESVLGDGTIRCIEAEEATKQFREKTE
jgi:sialic acid synthase SpsE